MIIRVRVVYSEAQSSNRDEPDEWYVAPVLTHASQEAWRVR